jgi:hypothetical protein
MIKTKEKMEKIWPKGVKPIRHNQTRRKLEAAKCIQTTSGHGIKLIFSVFSRFG